MRWSQVCATGGTCLVLYSEISITKKKTSEHGVLDFKFSYVFIRTFIDMVHGRTSI